MGAWIFHLCKLDKTFNLINTAMCRAQYKHVCILTKSFYLCTYTN